MRLDCCPNRERYRSSDLATSGIRSGDRRRDMGTSPIRELARMLPRLKKFSSTNGGQSPNAPVPQADQNNGKVYVNGIRRLRND